MLRYAIASRILFPGDDTQRQSALIRQCGRWAAEGIDFIQLREKDLPASDLASLARSILQTLGSRSPTKLLINSRPDVAIATSTPGVHLTSAPGELTAKQLRQLYASAGLAPPLISISCHSVSEVEQARKNRVDAILFGPVFEKFAAGRQIVAGLGLERLRSACTAASPIPVYALGGVTLENAHACISAGASGIAGIRLFHRS